MSKFEGVGIMTRVVIRQFFLEFVRTIKVLAGVGLILGLAACEQVGQGASAPATLKGPPVKLPANRASYDALSARDRVQHAIAVQTALENPSSGVAASWAGRDGGQGTVSVVSTHRLESGLVCRVLLETLEAGDVTQGINDVACWAGQEWRWLREGVAPPVLASLTTHQVKRDRSFRNLARRVKAKQSDLKLLNPSLGDRVEKGTIVYLPKPA